MASHSLVEFDLLSQSFQANEWAAYASMRSHRISLINPGGIFAIARFDDVRLALKDPETFSSAGYKAIFQPEWLAPDCHRDPVILRQDSPEHDRNRRLVNKCFVSRVIKPLEEGMRHHAESLFASIPAGAEIDFVEHFAYPFVLDVIGKIAGTSDQPGGETRAWIERTEAITHVRPDIDDVLGTEETIRKQNFYFDRVIEDRCQRPKNDVATSLVNAGGGTGFSKIEMRGLLDLFVGAGLNTSVHLLCHVIIFLGNNTRYLVQLRKSPELIPAFVEEILRFVSPTRCVPRTTTRIVQIADVEVPVGSTVLLMLAAANRDPDKFDEPDEFRLGRSNAKEHLAFGDGGHVCLGGALARMEVKIVLEALVKVFSQCTCPPPQQLEYVIALATHGVKRLPVEFR